MQCKAFPGQLNSLLVLPPSAIADEHSGAQNTCPHYCLEAQSPYREILAMGHLGSRKYGRETALPPCLKISRVAVKELKISYRNMGVW